MIHLINNNRKIILVNLVTFFVLALLLELLIYIGLRNPSYIPGVVLPVFRNYYQFSDRQIIQVSECGQYDPDLFYMLKPGTCDFRNREFHVTNEINSLGLRDDEASLSSPEIVVLGDSYSLGWGVGQTESFPQVLERLTGRKVLNAGMSSFGTARSMILLNRLPVDKTEFLVIQFHSNDHPENEEYVDHDFRLPIRSQKAYDSLASSIQQRQRYFLFKHLYGISKNLGRNLFSGLRGETKDPASAFEEASLFLRVLANHKEKLEKFRIIVFKTGDQDKLDDEFADAVDSLKSENDYESLNITTVRISEVLDDDDYFVLDDHIDASGHTKIARSIEKIMTTNP